MGQDSKIEWTDHTFNPWIGCTKVSDGCKNCYAEVDSPARIARGQGLELWGPNAARKIKARSGWSEPYKWDRAAARAGQRHRVFCASQSDVFEDRPELAAPRVRLFHLINDTPHLDWLLLTKRPENIRRFYGSESVTRSWSESAPPNVWYGTSVETEQYLSRIDTLKGAILARSIAFLSIEPLLGPMPTLGEHLDGINWVIVGGESGPNARPMHIQWVRNIRDQCVAAGVPFFFKQWGEWCDLEHLPNQCGTDDRYGEFHDRHADSWVESCLCEEGHCTLYRVGKKAAGRQLDGRTWDEMPMTAGVTR
jgi:protein gp37